MKIFWDLDLTVFDSNHKTKYFPYQVNKKVNKNGVENIITGRHIKYKKETKAQLKHAGFDKVKLLIMNPFETYTYEYLAKYKAEELEKSKAEVYIDNDEELNSLIMVWNKHIKCYNVDEWYKK